MKKLLLLPITLLTAVLVMAFASPNTTESVVRSVAPGFAIQLGGPQSAVVQAAVGQLSQVNSNRSSEPGANQSGSSGSAASSAANADNLFALFGVSTHTVSTPSRENCGRFGNGFHGGKHLFNCPNRPFPPPAH